MTAIEKTTLDRLIARHSLWLTSLGKEGEQLWLPDANLAGLDLAGRRLAEIHAPGAIFDKAKLAGADLVGANLVGASLVDADLSQAHLAKSNLDRVRAYRARFNGADLTRCTLEGADLREVTMDGAMLRRTLLNRADLRGSTLRNAQLDRIAVAEATLGTMDATGASGSILPGNAKLELDGNVRQVDMHTIVGWLQSAGADVRLFAIS